MADDGSWVLAGQEVLRFDTQELQTKILEKSNELNEKEKEVQKQNIVMREKLAELRLLAQEARADMDKAALKADIPEDLLAGRDFRENQILLNQARLTLALREAEVEREEVVMQTELEILDREIAMLKAEIEELSSSVDAMSTKAPTDGIVIHSVDQRGKKLAVGDNVWGGQRVIEFPDLASLELRLEIAERDSTRIVVGQSVSFNLDAAPDHEYHGRIIELASVVRTKSVNQPSRVFDATASVLDPDPELMRPGMSVTAKIHLPDIQEAGL
jgi:multidrug resistance efflux pump